MIDDKTIAELRKLDAEATPGDWEAILQSGQTDKHIYSREIIIKGTKPIGGVVIVSTMKRSDAELAVAARNALKPLLDEIERLRRACRIAEEALCRATFPGPRNQRDLNEAIDAIRAVLAEPKAGKESP